MRNICFILIVLCLLTASVMAQVRYVDFEAECLYPKGTYYNGDRGLLRFNGINHGPDNIMVGDSLWYILYCYIDNKRGKTFYQGPLRMPYDVSTGDKFYYMDDYNISLYFPDIVQPKEVLFCGKFINHHITPDGTIIEYSHKDTVAANDSCCQTLTILPYPTTNITSVNTNSEFAYIYPNPSNGDFQIIVDRLLIKEEDIALCIYDLNGRSVYKGKISRNQSMIPIRLKYLLSSGIYALHLQSENIHHVKKLIVD